MKLKELEKKHDHKLTEWLKVIIFSLLMLAPIFASISQMIYVSFNKNAYQSYSGTQQVYEESNKYETNELNTYNDLILGNIYELKYSNEHASFDLYFSEFYIVYNNEIESYYYMNEYYSYNEGTIELELSLNSDYIVYLDSLDSIYNYYFVFSRIDINDLDEQSFTSMFFESNFNVNNYVLTETSTLDNAFYYGVDQMTKSELFNWTQNTAVYTGVKAMTDNLQIQTPVVAILIVYWFILTIIYIIIDIVLALFTKLTHFLN